MRIAVNRLENDFAFWVVPAQHEASPDTVLLKQSSRNQTAKRANRSRSPTQGY